MGSCPRFTTASLLIALAVLAVFSLAWGVTKGRSDSADLERRLEEADLFARRIDPYQDEDMTYPPSAPPVFLALLAPIRHPAPRTAWLAANVLALGAFCAAVIGRWGRGWPPSAKLAFCLLATAAKPTRAGMALGQFHLMPLALMMLAMAYQGRAQSLVAGMLLGVALIKPTMAVPLALLLVFRRRWGTLGIAAIVQAVLSLGTAWWVRASPRVLWNEWLRNARGQLAMGTIDVPTIVSQAFSSMHPDGSRVSLAVLVVSAVVLWSVRKKSELGGIALACFLAAIFTYHRHYDMVLLLPALAYLLDRAAKGLHGGPHEEGFRRRSDVLCLVLAAFILVIPTPRWAERAYEIGFIAASYAGLGWLFLQVHREGKTS